MVIIWHSTGMTKCAAAFWSKDWLSIIFHKHILKQCIYPVGLNLFNVKLLSYNGNWKENFALI